MVERSKISKEREFLNVNFRHFKFLEKNSEYFLKGSLKLHLTIQLLMKNHEERHPTSIFEKMWGLSFKGLNLS